MQFDSKIVTCLWYDGEGEDAARFYTSVFPDSRITHVARFPAVGQEVHGQPAGKAMTVSFELAGCSFTALGAWTAASMSCRTVKSSSGSGVYSRTARRE